VEFQVEEDAPVGAGQLLDRRRSGGGEQLQTDLHHAEPRVQAIGQGDRGGEVLDVEGQGESIPHLDHH
jgi:hypothetical protein